MNTKVNEQDFEYNRWLVLSLFFNKNDQIAVDSTTLFENGELSVRTKLEFDGKTYTGFYSLPCPADADHHTYRRICLAVAGMSAYLAAMKARPMHLPWGTMTGIRPTRPVRQMLESGESDSVIADTLKKMYGVSDKKIDLCLQVAKNELPVIGANDPKDIGLYVGIPFCPSRCLYCSFVSADMRYTAKYMEPYCKLLAEEILRCAKVIQQIGRRIQSIYIGGGTPTSLSAAQLEALLSSLTNRLDLTCLKEFCVEAGRPDTITEEKLQVLLKYGVDRISINPQTMNKITLDSIGRRHSPEDIKAAFALARNAGFDNINTDLIAGLPGENAEMFRHTIDELLTLNPENITVHTMCVKRGSKLKGSLDSLELSHAEEVAKMLDAAQSTLPRYGYEPYYMYRQKNILGNLENVGYSKPGRESCYNVNIMEEVQTIFALGGGGVTKIVDRETGRIDRIFNYKEPVEYIKNFETVLARKDEILTYYNESSGKE